MYKDVHMVKELNLFKNKNMYMKKNMPPFYILYSRLSIFDCHVLFSMRKIMVQITTYNTV